MQGIIIRLAEPEDLPVLRDIYNDAVLNSVATFDLEIKSLEERREWFASHQTPQYPLLVAENSGIVVGWGSLSPFKARPAYDPTTEFSIYIDKGYRGLGIGEQLLQELLQRARDLRFHSVIGLITGSNEASLKLAAKYGFIEAGVFREVGRKFDMWLDVVVMQLLLD